MDKVIFQELTQAKRLEMIRDNADKLLPDYQYMRSFDEDEIVDYKEELTNYSLELNELKEELAALKKSFEEKMKPKKDRLKFLYKALREKGTLVKEECFAFTNFDTSEYAIYNAEGLQLMQRKLLPSERQRNIFQEINKTGTNS